MAKRELASRYKAFAEAYLKNGGNAYRAALTAGYHETTARAKSYQLLEREDVAAYIAERRRRMARRAVSPERVLLELADIGFGQREYPSYDAAGNEYERPPPMGARLKALELMGKNLGLFDKDARDAGVEGVTIVDDIAE